MTVDGPAAGHDRMRTSADPTGRLVLGTLNNCGGGQTPWGTYLTAEENFHGYFWTDQTDATGKRKTRGLGGAQDGVIPLWRPGKLVQLGRARRPLQRRQGASPIASAGSSRSTPSIRRPRRQAHRARRCHEGAELILNKDGRVVVYSGDDRPSSTSEFVSKEQYRPGDAPHNRRLLSEGTLSVARYEEDGSATWLPRVREGPHARQRIPLPGRRRHRRAPRRRPAARRRWTAPRTCSRVRHGRRCGSC